jgi:LCP family protein required for cell wall assembly
VNPEERLAELGAQVSGESTPTSSRFRWTFWAGLSAGVLAGMIVMSTALGYVLLHMAVSKVQRVAGLRVAPEVDGEPITYLLVGSDSRDAPQFAPDRDVAGVEGQRADVIIVVVLDPRRKAAVLLSIPRDTRVDIPGQGLDKINAAYDSGPQLIVDTVSQFIGLPINHFVSVGFVGFMKLVDAVGDVPLCSDHTLRDSMSGLYLTAGCHQLNGGAALPFVRSRYTEIEVNGEFITDPTADLGRIRRQQQFLRALFAKAARPANLPRFPRIAGAVSDTIQADPSFDEADAVGLAQRFLKFDPSRIFMVSLPGIALGDVDGVSYVLPSDSTRSFLAALREGRPLPGEPGRPIQLADVPLIVSNGNGIAGCGQQIADKIRAQGGQIIDVGDAGRFDVKVTELRYNPGDKPKAEVVRQKLGFGTLVESNRPGPEVEVVVGADAAKECTQ